MSLLEKKSGEWTISSSSSSKVLADPSFYSDAYRGLNFSGFVLGLSLYYFFIDTIYTVAGHCAKLNASCLRKGFFTPLRKFGSSCRWSALPPSYNRFIVWNGGKWSRDINQVLWLVICRSAQKRMSDDSTQRGCANKEHQTNYLQSGGANSHSDSKFLSFQLCHNLKLQFA